MKTIEDAMLFVDVAKAGSFTVAAERLYSSKSSISRRIAQLEQRLNAQLFVREPQGLQLTEAGQHFYRACEQIKQQFDQATESLAQHHSEVSGEVTITAPLTLGSMVIGPLLAKLMRVYPKLTLNLDLSDTVKSHAQDGIDIALRAARQLPDSELKARQLLSYRHVVCASPEYLDRFGVPMSPDALERHRIICCMTGSSTAEADQWAFMHNGKAQMARVKPVARVTHMGVQRQMALDDQGIIRVPNYWVDTALQQGQLIEILAEYRPEPYFLFAVYQNIQPLPNKVKACLDYLSEHLVL